MGILVKLSQSNQDSTNHKVTPSVVEDQWVEAEHINDSAIQQANLLTSLEEWLANSEEVAKRTNKNHSATNQNPYQIGIALENTAEIESHVDLIKAAALITIPFPTFTDGRGFSLARIIREQLGFKGELRATGDVLVDQLFFMYRCGFDAFLMAEETNIPLVLKSFETFSVTYQGAVDNPLPLYARL